MGPQAVSAVQDLAGRFADCEASETEFTYVSIKFNIKPGFIEKGLLDGIWLKDLLKTVDAEEPLKEIKWKTEVIEN